MGAIVISLLILGLWLKTAWEEFMLLVGTAADLDTQQLITYICMTIVSKHIYEYFVANSLFSDDPFP
jgi:hypothetical protein